MNSSEDFLSRRVAKVFPSSRKRRGRALRSIISHFWNDEGILFLKAQYKGSEKQPVDVPFGKLRMKEPIHCARYTQVHIAEDPHGDQPLQEWAERILEHWNHPKTIPMTDIFLGTVESCVSSRPKLWHILYDDGDEEDLNAKEMEEALEMYTKFQKLDFLPNVTSDTRSKTPKNEGSAEHCLSKDSISARATDDENSPDKEESIGEENIPFVEKRDARDAIGASIASSESSEETLPKESSMPKTTTCENDRKCEVGFATSNGKESPSHPDFKQSRIKTIEVVTMNAKGEKEYIKRARTPLRRNDSKQMLDAAQYTITDEDTEGSGHVDISGEKNCLSILHHFWTDDDVLHFLVQHNGGSLGSGKDMLSFCDLRRSEPELCARYIQTHMQRSQRGGVVLMAWTEGVLKPNPSVAMENEKVHCMAGSSPAATQSASLAATTKFLEKSHQQDSCSQTTSQKRGRSPTRESFSITGQAKKSSDEQYLSQRVAKKFSSGLYIGIVHDKNVIRIRRKRCPVWHVVYEDGDEEDLEWDELKEAMELYDKITNEGVKTPNGGKDSHKRQRKTETSECRHVDVFLDRRINTKTGKEEYLVLWKGKTNCTWETISDSKIQSDARTWWKQERCRRNKEALLSSDDESDEEIQIPKDQTKWRKEVTRYRLVAGELPESYDEED